MLSLIKADIPAICHHSKIIPLTKYEIVKTNKEQDYLYIFYKQKAASFSLPGHCESGEQFAVKGHFEGWEENRRNLRKIIVA